MYLLNLGHSWQLERDLDVIENTILLAVGNTSAKLREKGGPDTDWALFDPQAYLYGLDPEECASACSRLVSYEWYNKKGVPALSSDTKRSKWEKELKEKRSEYWPDEAPRSEDDVRAACESAVAFQDEIGCTHIILPTPLIGEREDEAATAAEWLDHGLEEVDEQGLELPVLATVAVAEGALNDSACDEGGLLDAIVDQVTAREGIDGVYIVVAQSQKRHPFETPVEVLRAYAYLSQSFAETYDIVLPNFVDVFGLVCMALGASGFGGGQSHILRRLSPEGFRKSGGTPLPHFYAHGVVAEFRTETDLDEIVKSRLVTRVSDETRFSRPLMAELRRRGSASNLPRWAEGRGKVTVAHQHFVYRIASEAKRLAQIEDLNEREDAVREWVESAAANSDWIRKRLERREVELTGKAAPTELWLEVLDEFTVEEAEEPE